MRTFLVQPPAFLWSRWERVFLVADVEWVFEWAQ